MLLYLLILVNNFTEKNLRLKQLFSEIFAHVYLEKLNVALVIKKNCYLDSYFDKGIEIKEKTVNP